MTVRDRFEAGAGEARRPRRSRRAPRRSSRRPGELAAPGGGYDGPLAERQGERMRPDVARAFDRMERAARADGVSLLVISGFRSDAEQAVLYARHPDPRWVAPPGRSLHRLRHRARPRAAEAHTAGWPRTPGASTSRSATLGALALRVHPQRPLLAAPPAATATGGRTLPDFVPAAFAPALARAAQRWNVSATLLAAQLYAESNFNPFAVSRAGAQGIAQFMPGTAAAMGLSDPFDAERAIDAQAHLMRDLLRQFPAVPLALAAYNAGPAPVAACGCVPANGETPGYVARILGLMSGAGAAGTGALEVRLVR